MEKATREEELRHVAQEKWKNVRHSILVGQEDSCDVVPMILLQNTRTKNLD